MENTAPTILVVEDEQIYRSLLEQTLQENGYQTVGASNGEEALQLLERIRADLILSDVRMPKMDGYTFYQRVRESPLLQTIPFLFLTALADKHHMVKGLELGVDDYITKPIDVDSLLAVIRGKLKQSSLVRQRLNEEVTQLKAEILRTLSHEFKTPLNIIIGVSSFLLNENVSFETKELTNLLSSIKRGGTQLSKLVDDFITAMNIDTGQMQRLYELQKVAEDVMSILRESMAAVEKEAAEHEVTVNVSGIDTLPLVLVNRAQVHDLLRQLLKFSILSSKKGATVTIATEYSRGLLRLHITIPGKQIPPDQIEGIFQKFAQYEWGNRERGMGLGLYIAKQLATINKCDLKCTSAAGKGTQFTLTFPQ